MSEQKKIRKLEHWHKIAFMLILFDMIAVNISCAMGLWIRYGSIVKVLIFYTTDYIYAALLSTVICFVVFLAFRLYNSIWRFASYIEMVRTVMAVFVNMVVHFALVNLIYGHISAAYYVIAAFIHMMLSLAVRFSYRFLLLMRSSRQAVPQVEGGKKVMLIGAGNAGQMILRDVNQVSNTGTRRICCIIDDNSNKWGRSIDGVPVVGGRQHIVSNIKKFQIDQILFAIPSATNQQKKDILEICKDTGCEIKSLPGLNQLVSGEVSFGDMREVAVEDLLGRDPIRVNMEEIYRYISGKTILVTGGGGSIGSELCRQVAAHNPKLLIVFDVYENNAYDIEQELKEKYPELNMKVLIGSVRDSRRLTSLFETYRPEVVYHAAAHKHVPLMEESPCESIKNNVIGTYKTAYAAMIYGCQRFVLISTDKAVNPTNIMGASKRLCEMVVQSFDWAVKNGTAGELPMLFTHRVDESAGVPQAVISDSFQTEFVAVRFGNVLGSNGSVIPLFKKQIAKGGPVTVTHPDIIRYFMTIPEAVSLVMQAGTYANGGEIFVLDMGVPVKIDTLARNLIKLSGYEPDVDIPIIYTGLRPGEKLYEEKLMDEEGLKKTPNSLIHIGCPVPFDTDKFLIDLEDLMHAAYENDENIVSLVAKIVTTYHPDQGGAGNKDATFQKLHKEAVGAH